MAPSSATAAAARRRTARPPARRPAPARVRWDRLGRTAMLFVLVVLMYLYISPVRSLIGAVQQSSARHGDVARLRAENARLRAQRDALQNQATLTQKARNLGLVLPGERGYIVSGLPAN